MPSVHNNDIVEEPFLQLHIQSEGQVGVREKEIAVAKQAI